VLPWREYSVKVDVETTRKPGTPEKAKQEALTNVFKKLVAQGRQGGCYLNMMGNCVKKIQGNHKN